MVTFYASQTERNKKQKKTRRRHTVHTWTRWKWYWESSEVTKQRPSIKITRHIYLYRTSLANFAAANECRTGRMVSCAHANNKRQQKRIEWKILLFLWVNWIFLWLSVVLLLLLLLGSSPFSAIRIIASLPVHSVYIWIGFAFHPMTIFIFKPHFRNSHKMNRCQLRWMQFCIAPLHWSIDTECSRIDLSPTTSHSEWENKLILKTLCFPNNFISRFGEAFHQELIHRTNFIA